MRGKCEDNPKRKGEYGPFHKGECEAPSKDLSGIKLPERSVLAPCFWCVYDRNPVSDLRTSPKRDPSLTLRVSMEQAMVSGHIVPSQALVRRVRPRTGR